MTRALVLLALIASGCTAAVADITVSEPKVYGDDQVLRVLAARGRALRRVAGRIEGADVQEVYGVSTDSHKRTTLGANLLDPATPVNPAPPGRGRTHHHQWFRSYPYGGHPYTYGDHSNRPTPGLSYNHKLRKEIDKGQHVSAYELLYLGDTRLLDRGARIALLRFEVSFNNYLDLGGQRKFAVVRFRIRGKKKPDPKFHVYLLSPDYSSLVSRESLRTRVVNDYAAQILGAYGGIGVTGSHGGRTSLRELFEAAMETPLQFAIYGSRKKKAQNDFTFAFAFGPRRRLHQRSLLNPARWFGAAHELTYEIQPGPRSCHALLVFPKVDPKKSVELVVSVFHDGHLLAEEEINMRTALRQDTKARTTFTVNCPPPRALERTKVITILPHAATHFLLVSDRSGPTFTQESVVFLGPVALTRKDVRVLGRGRLLVRVSPSSALLALWRRRRATTVGRVVTPDQPDFRFGVRLLGPKRKAKK